MHVRADAVVAGARVPMLSVAVPQAANITTAAAVNTSARLLNCSILGTAPGGWINEPRSPSCAVLPSTLLDARADRHRFKWAD